METIKSYLDNVFASLPKTAKVLELKNNMLSNMEDKYNELKRNGKSENEAIGIVISEFGNIDELIHELGVQNDNTANSQPLVTTEEVEAYLNAKRILGIQIGIGVFVCILAPALFILLSVLVENGVIFTGIAGDAAYVPGLILLLVLIAIAVVIFIFSDMNFDRYKFMEAGVILPSGMKSELKKRYDSYNPTYYLCVIVGVCLCILSPTPIFISLFFNNETVEEYSIPILLLIIAIAVFLFISSGTIRESYEKLLKIGDSAPKKKEDKVIGAIAAIVWPLAVIIFLYYGIVYHLWHIAWIVFPIVGILFGMFSAVYNIITNKENG
jgi:hypothetical protein